MQKIENGRRELPPIFDVLNNLVSEQKKETESIKFPLDFLSWESWFMTTTRFKNDYKEALKFSLMPHNAEEYEMNGHGLAGKMFEDVAYLITSYEEAKKGRVVLSPERTLSFWERLYPSAEKNRVGVHQTSLDGVFVPDGLVIKCIDKICTVLSICEYTASRRRDISGKKFGFDQVKKNFPNILGQSEFLFVTASGGHDSEDSKRLPFSNRRFHDFVEFIFRGFSPVEGSATLRDIQERVREQYRRTLEHSKTGQLTMQESLYLDRIAISSKLV